MDSENSILEDAKTFLQSDKAEVVGNDDQIESENRNEDDGVGANGGQDADVEAETNETKSDKKPKSKISSLGKMIRRVISPRVPEWLLKINLDLHFKASNQKGQPKENNDPIAGTSTGEVVPTRKSALNKREDDAKEIKKDMEHMKTALSKLEGQLATSQADNDRLTTELNVLQELKQGLTCNLEVQNEKHRNEVKRLDLELNTATESLAKMKLTNQKQLEELCRLRADLESLAKEKEGLIKKSEQREISYSSELNKLMESLQQTKLENTDLTERVHKLKGQLGALQVDNHRLNSKLHDLQELKQGLIRNLEVQNEKHRNEVKRLDLELNTATESLAKMKLTNQKQLEELCRLRADLESLAKEKEGLIKKSEQREISYSSELNKLMESLQQTKLENTELTERVHKLTDNLQITAEQMKESKTKNMQLEQKLRETQSEKHKINAQLDAANAKITELRRAIQILESNPFTTTTAQLQSEGTFTCPLCGASFGSLANMQLHAEDCNG